MIYYSYDKAGEVWADIFYTDERTEDYKSKVMQPEVDRLLNAKESTEKES